MEKMKVNLYIMYNLTDTMASDTSVTSVSSANLDIFMQKYIHLVSTRCNCDKNVLESIYKELIGNEGGGSGKVTCKYEYSRGANKGKYCGDNVFENTLCKKHAKQQATKDKIQGKTQKASESVVVSQKKEVKTSESVVVSQKKEVKASESVVVSQKKEVKASESVVVPQKKEVKASESVVVPQKKEVKASESVVVVPLQPPQDEPVIHFDSKLGEIMMHTNKSPSEITKVYEKIIPNQVGVVPKKRRILPPSLRPELKIGDKIVYNDGKKTCKAVIKKFIKDMAELENVTESSIGETSSFTGPTRYMTKQK
jgi:hypothetical protein